MDAKKLEIDLDYLREVLVAMLRIPSPTGRTDEIMQYVGERVDELGLDFELTRRGAMLASLEGRQNSPDRAVMVHTDTIGCMVRELKDNGRLAVVPVGTHSARFAEGNRVTLFTDDADLVFTGTILPLKASGHAFDHEVDEQPVAWTQVEVRIDEPVRSRADLEELGIRVGDFVAIQALPEITQNGFVKSRHLDDKAGVAAVLAAFKALIDHEVELEVGVHLLVTISEEVGTGASHGLSKDVAEMVSIDSAVVAPGQSSREDAVTVAMQDLHGPFDYHLTRKLLRLASAYDIPHERDVFIHYRSDVAAALEAGAETRAALIGPGTDATHGFERTHLEGLRATAELVCVYLQTDFTFGTWDAQRRGPLKDFPSSSVQPARRDPSIQDTPDD